MKQESQHFFSTAGHIKLGSRANDSWKAKPLACVMGDMDMVRPLGLAGIPCAVVARRGGPQHYSRFTRASLDWTYSRASAEELVDALVRFGSAQPERPILFYEHDEYVLLLARHRERLQKVFSFVLPDPTLVEDLVDKARFQDLAQRLELPVPKTRRLRPAEALNPTDVDLPFPLILKPLTRHDRDEPWVPIGGTAKALCIGNLAALIAIWPSLAATSTEFLAQELVPGPETCIESYHVYVDEGGTIVADFTGRKIRTRPVQYGHSTALVITDASDVQQLGRELVQRLVLRGVAKFDFKRGPDGKLHLLEINPRFTLWNHLGAVAGVNIPALVYGDLVGLPRPVVPRARAGTRWCAPWQDAKAAKAWGVPLIEWLPWIISCEAKSGFAWDDPMPLLIGKFWWRLSHLVNRSFREARLSVPHSINRSSDQFTTLSAQCKPRKEAATVMHEPDTSTPVVVLASLISGHGIARSLGRLGIPVYGIYDSNAVAVRSRYWKHLSIWDSSTACTEQTLSSLLELGRKIGSRPVLIPTTDHNCIFVSDHAARLQQEFRLPLQPPGLARALVNKQEMYLLCRKHAIPTPETFFPQSRADVLAYLPHLHFPVVIKGINSWALRQRSGVGMVVVNDANTLLHHYDRLEAPETPNLMLQAYVRGGPDTRWMFNGYFNETSKCLFGFTGKKLRQNPPGGGMTSLGLCETNDVVARQTQEFMQTVGYCGILDVDYKYDLDSGEYKLLDVNPRIGASFRLFVGSNGMDVARTAYLHLTGQPVTPAIPCERRKWLVENYDAISSFKYWREGELGVWDWIRSFKGVEEASWFAWDDPLPFMTMGWRSLQRTPDLVHRLAHPDGASAGNCKATVPSQIEVH